MMSHFFPSLAPVFTPGLLMGSVLLIFLVFCVVLCFYPLANEVAKGYSNATVRPSFRSILVNTLESTSFNGF